MEADDYERHLREELCWSCHVATHRSHARQRQCPKCRRKWSFAHLRLRWALLQRFFEKTSVRRAALEVGCSYPTAWWHFERFKIVIRTAGLWENVYPKDWVAGDAEEMSRLLGHLFDVRIDPPESSEP
ncbi:MAG TPA: hypothetical protein PLU30_21700 [Verrucomicrobiae bacterium]|nr:hypothetical protein [Verrucomicrobiae bacterium]